VVNLHWVPPASAGYRLFPPNVSACFRQSFRREKPVSAGFRLWRKHGETWRNTAEIWCSHGLNMVINYGQVSPLQPKNRLHHGGNSFWPKKPQRPERLKLAVT
jgi:hypothetical protein